MTTSPSDGTPPPDAPASTVPEEPETDHIWQVPLIGAAATGFLLVAAYVMLTFAALAGADVGDLSGPGLLVPLAFLLASCVCPWKPRYAGLRVLFAGLAPISAAILLLLALA